MTFWLEILVGFAALVVGADFLVRGASKIAAGFGVPPIVIGLTLVAYGTSAPEFAVSATAAIRGVGAISLGNAFGSNVVNIGLVLGLSALIRPIEVEGTLVRREAPLLVGIALLFPLFFLDGALARWEGLLAVAGGIAFTVWSLKTARQRENAPEKSKLGPGVWLLSIGFCGAGIAGLLIGADWLVSGATELARILGMSARVIGLTVVAVGTSLPELATSVVAMIRGQSDIAVGNVIGSNIFNLLFALGGAVSLAPISLAGMGYGIWVDAGMGLLLALLILPFARSGKIIARWEGAVFLALYAGYVTYLVLAG
ncbi:MAG: calcium/sodium antiporter [bacterium]|nr:calcium/sodium antiporter [bacterium]